MGILKRLILLFYIPIVFSALVVLIGIALHMIPPDVWQSQFRHLISQKETLIVLSCMVLASFILFTAVFSSDGGSKTLSALSGDIQLEQGKPGEVQVAVNAIVSVVERAAILVSGVRDVEAFVYKQEGEIPIRVKLIIVLAQGYSAPKVSEATTAAVDEALMVALELPKVPVEIKVKEVTHAIIEREKRVV
ncbi:MAG: alkaline shock response membrane anchor protein AmaP [Selenomonadaceae bacterium]|nr:alkaline shock response membrane anchor protein AmaP [Selenomonadaceae bacterium]